MVRIRYRQIIIPNIRTNMRNLFIVETYISCLFSSFHRCVSVLLHLKDHFDPNLKKNKDHFDPHNVLMFEFHFVKIFHRLLVPGVFIVLKLIQTLISKIIFKPICNYHLATRLWIILR